MSAGRAARRPQAHWGVLVVLLLALVGALLLQGVTEGSRSGTGVAVRSSVPLPGGSAVAYDGRDGLASRPLEPRSVALTFDDGPDPRWTPAVLDLLRREGVPATFFVTGAQLAAHPDLVRRAVREGHEVGLHTWSHRDLSELSSWRARLELSLTQLGLAGATGRTSALVRPPFSSTPGALDADGLAVVRRATGDGYLVVLADQDARDWERPGAAAVERALAPTGDDGTVLLLHDGGGDRAQTLAALPAVIASHRAAGHSFTTVSGGLGLPAQAGLARAGGLTALQGDALLLAVGASGALVTAVTWLVLPVGALMLLRTLLVIALAGRHVRAARARVGDGTWAPGVSVLVPAYDEAVGIEATVRSLVASDHTGPLEVVVVDDGSSDGTPELVEALVEREGLTGVRVVRQANAGKAMALARGAREARHDLLVMLDGDTVFEPETVRWLVQPLQDPRVGAVSGNTKVGNRHGLLGRWQHLEYVMGFNLDRRMLDLFGCIPTVPGASGAFRRAALDAAGGMSTDTLAEDTDITMAITRAGYRVVYEERARAWTEAPLTFRDLWRQRYRWAYGTLQCVWKHRAAVRERSTLGLVGIPYMLTVQVLLALLSPVVDVFAVHGLLTGDAVEVLAFWTAFQLLGVVSAAYALRLDGESLRPLWALPLQQVVYRQLMYLVVIQSVVAAVSGVRLPWHKLERTGVDADLVPAGAP